jgi:hypothetical protein
MRNLTAAQIGSSASAGTANTAATTGLIDAQYGDKIVVYAEGGSLAGAETIGIFVTTGTSGLYQPVPKPDLSGALTLNVNVQSVMLEGGFEYFVSKSATAAAIAVGYHIKARIL